MWWIIMQAVGIVAGALYVTLGFIGWLRSGFKARDPRLTSDLD